MRAVGSRRSASVDGASPALAQHGTGAGKLGARTDYEHAAALLDQISMPSGLEFDQIYLAIKDTPPVGDVHDLHIWSLSSYEAALSCHVCLRETDLSQGPQIVRQINAVLSERFGIRHATIQIEADDCERTDLLCKLDSHTGSHK